MCCIHAYFIEIHICAAALLSLCLIIFCDFCYACLITTDRLLSCNVFDLIECLHKHFNSHSNNLTLTTSHCERAYFVTSDAPSRWLLGALTSTFDAFSHFYSFYCSKNELYRNENQVVILFLKIVSIRRCVSFESLNFVRMLNGIFFFLRLCAHDF